MVTECREDARSYTGRQSLRVQRGTDAAVIVADTGTVVQEPPGLPGTCRLFGEGRAGIFSVLGGAFQRLAVSPDGSGVVFEVTSRFSIIRFRPSMPEAGFYFVRPDGSGLRRIGPASREALFRFVLDVSAPLGFRTTLDPTAITFTADGRKVAFFDRGPGPDSEDTQQLVTLDVTTGERFQVTHLPAPPPLAPDVLPTYNPLLRQNGTISFRTFTNPNELNPGGGNQIFTVEPDGTDLKRVPIPVVLPGGIDPNFQITGAQPTSVRLSLPDGTSEIFFSDHNNLLQLTNFGLSDTIPDWCTPTSTSRRRSAPRRSPTA